MDIRRKAREARKEDPGLPPLEPSEPRDPFLRLRRGSPAGLPFLRRGLYVSAGFEVVGPSGDASTRP